MKSKIGWCDMTWNPVWGCLNNCEYCYARKIAKLRYKQMIEIEFNHYWRKHHTWAWIGDHLSGLKDFRPTFLEAQFDKIFPQKAQKIFIGSMSEIYYWKDEWLEKVLEKVKLYPQHIFQFLTRYPEVYDKYIFPKNCWLGVTITREKDFERGIPYLFITSCNITFVSVEPILEYINPKPFSNANIDWVILGAETGNRKGKIVPKKKWIEKILWNCRGKRIPVYIKDNLIKYYPQYEKYKQFPDYKQTIKIL